jgi:heat shock protein HspQ
VIFDVDPRFSGTEEWYRQMARSQPPRDKPWYRVLVDGSVQETYPVEHPLVTTLFDAFDGGAYRIERRPN